MKGGGDIVFNHVKKGVYSGFFLLLKDARSTKRRRGSGRGTEKKKKKEEENWVFDFDFKLR